MNEQKPRDLRLRTKQLALRIIKVSVALPKTMQAQVVGKQVLRCGTSVGAQYREAARARSTAEFISKVSGALQELDETQYWLEILSEALIIPESQLKDLIEETNELAAILMTCIKTARSRAKNDKMNMINERR